MNREELKKMGLTDEQINQVMASHGQSVNALNTEVANWKKTAEDAQAETTERNKEIERLKPFEEQVGTLTTENGELKSKASTAEKNSKVVAALAKSNAHDVTDLMKFLDQDSITLDDKGNLQGLDDQLKSLQEGKAWLFQTGKPAVPSYDPAGGVDPKAPKTMAEAIESGIKSQLKGDA